MKKRIFVIFAMLLVMTIITACGNGGTSGSADSSKQGAVEKPAKQEETTKAEKTAKKEKAEIEETVLLDEAGVKVTALELKNDSFWGPELKVLIENNSGQALTFQTRNTSINRFMVDAMFSEDVADGKKANASISFTSETLEACGIDQIATIELSFHIFNSASWDNYFDSSQIVLNTSVAESYTQEVDESGQLVYDEGGIKIITKSLNEDSIFGPSVRIYVENNSNQNITVQARDVSVNDFMINPVFSADVLNGKRALSDLSFFGSELEDNNIEKIEKVELSFHIFDMDSWDGIVDTDTITLTF